MAAQRRVAAPDAKNHDVLLDAAERLMLEEGYAAVTSRRVAEKAGLKSQLVHYYFRTMDDLFLAMFRRRAEEGLRHQQELLDSDRPLQALWQFNTESESTSFTMEIASLAHHREKIRTEVRRYSERFRTAQLEVASAAMERYRVPRDVCTPAALVVMMTAAARIMAMEENLGFSQGHPETAAYMERYVRQLESFAIQP